MTSSLDEKEKQMYVFNKKDNILMNHIKRN